MLPVRGLLRKYERMPCSLVDVASVTSGYMGGRVTMDNMSVGTSGTNVPGRTIVSRAFATFGCGGTALQQSQEILAARLVFKVKTSGAPASPDIVVKGIASQVDYDSNSYIADPITADFVLNANMPSTWSLDVKSAIKLPEVKSGYYTFRAESAASATLTGFDGYDLRVLGPPELLLDFVAP
jgi:hypothetical protein